MSEKKSLVVVESPAKAKTINKYLGKSYIVEASVGHIKDLVEFKLGVDVKNDFKPHYVTIKGKNEIIKKIKLLSKDAKEVLIATDPDREGEAIAWHIGNEVKPINEHIKRVLFIEITKDGIKKGIESSREIDENLFMSQQARRVLDRLIGYQVSPFLSRAMLSKTSQSLSAGRVQSVALRLICERESEILNFVPIDYWSIFGDFTFNSSNFTAKLISFNKKTISNPEGSAKSNNPEEQKSIDKKLKELHYIHSEEEANSLKENILQEKYSVKDITKKKINRKPAAPFTTSSLQQEASKRLGFSNKKTMNIAQKLYEGVTLGKEGSIGLITYMRTDSTRINPEAQNAAQIFIEKTFGKEFVPDKPPVYSTKSKNVQDAHEAIRVTNIEFTPSFIKKFLEKDTDSYDLYELIYNRFLASQMTSAIYEQTAIDIKDDDFIFRVTGSVILFKGFLAVYDDIKEDKSNNGNGEDYEGNIPVGIKKNDKLKLNEAKINKSQTKPRPRFNNASLVKELDELGIGRPSTYATIVSTLTDRNYVDVEKKSFMPTELGVQVNEVLVQNFPDIFDVSFTAEMEQNLDLIADGEKTYLKVLNEFYTPFSKSLSNAEKKEDNPDLKCDKCGSQMIIKVNKRGRFLACSNYPECKNTKPLPKDEEKEKVVPQIAEGITCDICGKPMYIRESRFGKFYGCTDYPTCKGTKPFTTGISCPKCHEGIVIERFSPKSKKKFYGCSRYPKCDYISNYEPVNKECPNCKHDGLEVHFRKNNEAWEKFLKCPECKESFEMK